MDLPGLLALLLPFVWTTWTAATAVLALRTFRRELLPNPALRRVLWIATCLALAAFAATFVLPARIDSSGLLELSTGTEPWKGAAGEALLAAVAFIRPLDHEAIIVFTRTSVVPATMLAVLVIAQRSDGSPANWVRAGIDLRALLAVLVLLVTPSFLYGALGVFNFWFFCLVSLGLLLSWHEVAAGPTLAGRISLVSSVLLLGFARPETIAGGIIVAALAVGMAAKRRDFRLLVLSVIAFLLLIAAAPSVSHYLADRMRNQPLLMGGDATGSAPAWHLPWIAIRRILTHAPVNLLVLLVALHSIGVLCVVRVARILRSRSASWVELAALGLIVSEFLAIGVHREGFVRYIKYGQLLVVPCWYLASRIWYSRPVDGRLRAQLKGALGAGAVVMSASLMLTGPGFNRCSLPEGRTLSARLQDEVLLWVTTPRWVRSLCGPGQAEPARVLVVGLDERVPRKDGSGIEDAFSQPECEPERSPMDHLIGRGGCDRLAIYPDSRVPIDEALFGTQPGALCRAMPFRNRQGAAERPTHAIVSFYRPERAAEVRAAIAAHPECGWEVVESTESALLLRGR